MNRTEFMSKQNQMIALSLALIALFVISFLNLYLTKPNEDQ